MSPSWLSPGASVTLSCEVEHPSAGWRFYWYKAAPDMFRRYAAGRRRRHSYFYTYEPLPGSMRETEESSYIIHGQAETAGYGCRAGRGNPVYYSDYSQAQFVWSGGQFFFVCFCLHSFLLLISNIDLFLHTAVKAVALMGKHFRQPTVTPVTVTHIVQNCQSVIKRPLVVQSFFVWQFVLLLTAFFFS